MHDDAWRAPFCHVLPPLLLLLLLLLGCKKDEKKKRRRKKTEEAERRSKRPKNCATLEGSFLALPVCPPRALPGTALCCTPRVHWGPPLSAMTVAHEVTRLASNTGGSLSKSEVSSAVKSYEEYHTCYGGDDASRKTNYADMVNKYYDLATSFYEYGWGQSFHFAHRLKVETLQESIKRHEHYLALRLGLQPGMKVLDVGCGIGGPLREISAFSGASVTGLNNNTYQITRGIELNKAWGLDKTCGYIKADFMNMPVPDNTYDAVYTIEASCHAPDPVACYKEIKRVLKPGQLFAGYEWCMTDSYDPKNKEHQQIKAEIELGNGLPDVRTTRECLEALKAAGFEVLMEEDMARSSPLPWYLPLDTSRISLSSFRLTKVGRFLTHHLVQTLEFLGLAPEGSVRVSNFLEKAADGLVAGGRKEIFTPMYFFLVRKPADA